MALLESHLTHRQYGSDLMQDNMETIAEKINARTSYGIREERLSMEAVT